MKTRFYQIMAVSALCLAAAALAIALWTSARAQEEAPQAALAIPTTLNYQGYLREPDGSLTTGTHDITAKIYNDPVCVEPECELYSTTLPGVTVRDGLFNIVLGDDPAIPSSVFANLPLYIGITLDSGTELIPRQRLHAVPWAFQASTLVTNATVHGLTSDGDVSVNGDAAMNGNVTVAGNVVITGTLSHPGESFVGPHFLDQAVEIKGYGSCPATNWATFDSPLIPDGATAVILQYLAIDNETGGTTLQIKKQVDSAQVYILGFFRALGGGDDVGWGGQGIFPIKDDGSFQWQLTGSTTLDACYLALIGYYK